MQDLTQEILELVRLTATDLPPDVEQALRDALRNETPGSAAYGALESILKNVDMARRDSTPICQDTGTPIFYVYHPFGWRTIRLREQIENAVARATELSYLRPNAVHAITGINSGNNLGDEHYPSIHFHEVESDELIIDLLLKGGGCENVGIQYSLPNAQLGAGRDLNGVRKVVLDAVYKAQGKGCAPGILGVAIGGDRTTSYLRSKEVLFRKLHEPHEDAQLRAFEENLTQDANQLGIGPMGFGGKTSVLGVKVSGLHRLPASFFVTISYMCWAYRRRRMIWQDDSARYE